jgi:hypothetical protein
VNFTGKDERRLARYDEFSTCQVRHCSDRDSTD